MTTTGEPADPFTEVERLRTLVTTAARMLRNAAEVYRHLQMDTHADQELHQRQIDLLDKGAAALVAASGSPPVLPGVTAGLGLLSPRVDPNPAPEGAS